MGADIIRSAVAKQTEVLFIAHRKELIDQSYRKLAEFGVAAGVLMGTDSRRDDYQKVQVASIQTLARRMDRLPRAGLIVPDECHHALSDTWQDLFKCYPSAFILGLTATPWRGDRRGLGDVFQDSVLAATPAELIELGYLVRYDAYAYDAPDLHEVKITAGDYNSKDLGLACNTDVLVGSAVREYIKHASGKRAICFPVDIAHSKRVVSEFVAAGVPARHLDCETPKDEREEILAGLASGSVLIVSSVGVLTEGFDCPAAEVCILLRPTKSLTLHLQMIGRVLRPCDGKLGALIHDHAGNLLRLGLPDDERDYSLVATPSRVRALHTCPLCFNVFGIIRPDGTCPKCGELIGEPRDPNAPPAAERNEKTQVDGERIGIEQIRKLRDRRVELGLRDDLTDQQLRLAARATREEKAAEYLRLKSIQESKQLKRGFVGHQFRGTFSHWPKFTEEELATATPAVRPFLKLPRK